MNKISNLGIIAIFFLIISIINMFTIDKQIRIPIASITLVGSILTLILMITSLLYGDNFD